MKKIISLGLSVAGLAGLLMAATVQTASAACVKNVAYGDKLNIRTGPGARYRKKGAIPRRACGVRVFWGNRVGNWLDVRYAGVRGWVNRRFIGGSGGGHGGGVCKPRVKVFKSGGAGSWFDPFWKKAQIKWKAKRKWRNTVRNLYGSRYNKWFRARGKVLTCTKHYPGNAYVCRAEARPCR